MFYVGSERWRLLYIFRLRAGSGSYCRDSGWRQGMGVIVEIQARKDTECSKINGLFCESLGDKKYRR